MRSQTLSSKDDAGDDYHDHNDSILLFEFPHFIRQFFPVISLCGGEAGACYSCFLDNVIQAQRVQVADHGHYKGLICPSPDPCFHQHMTPCFLRKGVEDSIMKVKESKRRSRKSTGVGGLRNCLLLSIASSASHY